MFRQTGVLHYSKDLEVAVLVDQPMDQTGRKPNQRSRSKWDFTETLTRKGLNGPSSIYDQIGFRAREVHVRTTANQSVSGRRIVNSQMTHADSTREEAGIAKRRGQGHAPARSGVACIGASFHCFCHSVLAFLAFAPSLDVRCRSRYHSCGIVKSHRLPASPQKSRKNRSDELIAG